MKVTLSGFDELEEHLEKLEKNIKKLEGKDTISFSELFPASFTSKYTDFSSIEELVQSGNFDVKAPEDFEKIPEPKMNSFIGPLRNSGTEKHVKLWNGFQGQSRRELFFRSRSSEP